MSGAGNRAERRAQKALERRASKRGGLGLIAPWLDVPVELRPRLLKILDALLEQPFDELDQREVIADCRGSGTSVVQIVSRETALEAFRGLPEALVELAKPLAPGRTRITLISGEDLFYFAGVRLMTLAKGGQA